MTYYTRMGRLKFDESLVDRGEDGKFTSGGGGSRSAEKDREAERQYYAENPSPSPPPVDRTPPAVKATARDVMEYSLSSARSLTDKRHFLSRLYDSEKDPKAREARLDGIANSLTGKARQEFDRTRSAAKKLFGGRTRSR